MSIESFISNERLVAMVKQKNDDAFKILLDRFSKFILFKCNCFKSNSLDIDLSDLVQECEIALYKAALEFKPELGFQFTTYFKSVLTITIKRELKRAYTKKQRADKNECMIHDLTLLEQKASDKVEETPEGYLIKKESQKDLYEKIVQCLSYLERTCLILFIKGYSYNQIAQKLGIQKKSVDGAMFRARKKLSKYIDLEELLKLIKNM